MFNELPCLRKKCLMNNEKLKILCLDDVEADAIIIREQLSGENLDFQFDHASTGKDFEEKLRSEKYDIVLSDYYLPGFNGLAALILTKKIQPDIPFICISGTIGEDLAIELLHLGASDFIIKDKLTKLPIAIKRALMEVREHKARIEAETERKLAEEEIKNMKDSLEHLNAHLEEIRENERASIARELHDQLGQALTAIQIDLDWLRDKLAGDSEEGLKLEGMINLIKSMSSDVQRISFELRPSILDDLGLVSAMEWYAREFEKRTGIYCILNLEEIQIPDMKKNLALYRILQESLTNVSRHSQAKLTKISLKRIKDSVIMQVADDGIGTDIKKINSYKSLGFIGIRERLKLHNGDLKIQSAGKKGTKLSITIPFN